MKLRSKKKWKVPFTKTQAKKEKKSQKHSQKKSSRQSRLIPTKSKMETTKDISEDFALLEYTFRQYANYTNSQETYTFSQKSPKSFYLTVRKSRNPQN